MLKALDTDGDGSINYEEVRGWMEGDDVTATNRVSSHAFHSNPTLCSLFNPMQFVGGFKLVDKASGQVFRKELGSSPLGGSASRSSR